MSAFHIGERSINAIATAAAKYELINQELVEKWSEYLSVINDISVNYRYKQNNRTPHKYCSVEEENLMQVVKLCECYEYQSCEFQQWDNTFAKSLIEKLIKIIIKETGYENYKDTLDYKKAEWGYQDIF